MSRKKRPREFRRLWIQQVNAAAREHGYSYSRLIGGLTSEQIQINRKMLAELAQSEPLSFKSICSVPNFSGPGKNMGDDSCGLLKSLTIETDGSDPFLKPRRVRRNYSLTERIIYGMRKSRTQKRREAATAALEQQQQAATAAATETATQ